MKENTQDTATYSEDIAKIVEECGEPKADVLNFDDIKEMVPALAGHEKLVNRLMRLLKLDKINDLHHACMDTPGATFAHRLISEQLKVRLRVDGEHVLDHLPEGAFITVSNHPFGALDGIALIDLIGSRRPRFRVMVNMILDHIWGMRPSFIAVDQSQSDDPEKRKHSVNGIRKAMRMLSNGDPVGFFPAGAMSKVNSRGRLQDREWQSTVLQIIHRAKVPVIPIFFHGSNSWFFNFLGVVWWQARTLLLPRELVGKSGKEIHISVGDPISVEEQSRFATPEELGAYLREKTYALRDRK